MMLSKSIKGFISHRKIELLLKIATIYLTLWWVLFFLMPTQAIEVLPNSFLPYIHIFPIIHVANIGLWLCSTKIGKLLQWPLLLIFMGASIFYLILAVLKGLPAYKVGAVIYVIAIAYILSWRSARSATPA